MKLLQFVSLFAVMAARVPAVQGSCEPEVTDFTLIDKEQNMKVGRLFKQVDYRKIPSSDIAVEATVSACVKSLLFSDGKNTYCDTEMPFTFVGDSGTLSLSPGGPLNFFATPFSGPNCSGKAGSRYGHRVDVIDDACPGKVVGFKLWDGVADVVVQDLHDGDVICKSKRRLNFEAVVESCDGGRIRSVLLELSGVHSMSHRENFAPYMLAGDIIRPRKIRGMQLPAGKNSLRATPHSRFNLRGASGHDASISFELLDC